MEERNDYMIISPPNNLIQVIIALILVSPLCFIDLILERMGFGKSENYIASIFITIIMIIIVIGLAFEYNTQYRIDRNGVARIIFKKYKKFISWNEMKYIGLCKIPDDIILSSAHQTKFAILFSKISFEQYNKCHIRVNRYLEYKNYIEIPDDYINCEIYEKKLEFSGGERNIP